MSISASQIRSELLARRTEIIRRLVELEFHRDPTLDERYGAAGRAKSMQDAGYHLDFLAEAVAAQNSTLFLEYLKWASSVLEARHVDLAVLKHHFQCLIEILPEFLDDQAATHLAVFLQDGLSQIGEAPRTPPSFLEGDFPLRGDAVRYLDFLLAGKRIEAMKLVEDLLGEGTDIKLLYLDIFQRTQWEIGRLWQLNQVSVAQEHYCTASTQLIMAQLYPHVIRYAGKGSRVFAAACIESELHEMGLRVVSDFFEMDGWKTHYMGANLPSVNLIDTVSDLRPDVLGISASLTAHIGKIAELIGRMRNNPALASTKILVGGHPFNIDSRLAATVGADACAPDAEAALNITREWFGQ